MVVFTRVSAEVVVALLSEASWTGGKRMPSASGTESSAEVCLA